METQQVEVGVDGCSVPTFAVPLRNAAWAMARLCDPVKLPETRAAACRKITHAMTSNARMVAGPGRFDTALMDAADGKILCKAGAEGYQIMGLMPGPLFCIMWLCQIQDQCITIRYRPAPDWRSGRPCAPNFSRYQHRFAGAPHHCPGNPETSRRLVIRTTAPAGRI